MPPKRGTSTRASGPAKRGRTSARGRGKGVKEHVRVLSDITEESTTQVPTKQVPEEPAAPERTTRSSKKRSFEESAYVDDGDDDTTSPPERETRAQTAKKVKHQHDPTPEQVSVQPSQAQDHSLDEEQVPLQEVTQTPPIETTPPPQSPFYVPTLNLLFFIHLSALDTDADTENITLSLIDLTLADANWHPGLSGMVQPVACFLIASLLTRKQNLVEDIAASVKVFGLGYEELVEGYKLLWQWRENMAGAVGAYAERLDELPEPGLLLGQHGGQLAVNGYGQEDGFDGRPEPERWDEAIEV